MNIDEIELKCLLGLPIEIDDLGKLYVPLGEEIAAIGESQYNKYLSHILINKDKINVSEEESNGLTTFHVIVYFYFHDPDFNKTFRDAIKFFFKEEIHLCPDDEDVFFYFGNIEENRYLNEGNIEFVQALIRISNQVKESEEEEEKYNPADEETARMIAEMLERRRNKPKPKPTVNLHSIISGLGWKSPNTSINELGKLNIYQIYDGFHRLESIDSYHYTLVGIYSGNVDGKSINYNKIHWTKILK